MSEKKDTNEVKIKKLRYNKFKENCSYMKRLDIMIKMQKVEMIMKYKNILVPIFTNFDNEILRNKMLQTIDYCI